MSGAGFLLLPVILSSLIESLGHDDFQRRESASAALAALGPIAIPGLERAASSDDPEVRSRARHLLGRHYRTHADAIAGRLLPRGWTHLPWIDCLPGHAWGETQGYLTLAHEGGTESDVSGQWPSYRRATRLWLSDQLAGGVPPRVLQRLLDEAAAKEAAWHRANQVQRGTPP